MSKVKQTLYGILKGKFLVDEDAQKNWGFIIFLTLLALLMISSSHQIDNKVKWATMLSASCYNRVSVANCEFYLFNRLNDT